MLFDALGVRFFRSDDFLPFCVCHGCVKYALLHVCNTNLSRAYFFRVTSYGSFTQSTELLGGLSIKATVYSFLLPNLTLITSMFALDKFSSR